MTANAILAALPLADRGRLAEHFELTSLASGKVLLDAEQSISCVYFPLSGVLAKLVRMESGHTSEVGMVGNEGITPLSLFFGREFAPFRIVVQNAGKALKMRTNVFRTEVEKSVSLQRLLLSYSGAMLGQITQSSACNRLHSVPQRFCRFLLMTHDRVGTSEFFLKQEWAGHALGVRRMSITPAAQALQKAGLIRYRRGHLIVLNRAGLEASACECYRRIKAMSNFRSLGTMD